MPRVNGNSPGTSSAVPAVFQPVRIGDREYVDGGLVAPEKFPDVVQRISFFVNAGVRFVEEMCKMRAFVELWDEIGIAYDVLSHDDIVRLLPGMDPIRTRASLASALEEARVEQSPNGVTLTFEKSFSQDMVARSLETALHQMHEIHFPLASIVSGIGTAPLAPPSDESQVTV